MRSSHERWDGGGYPDGLAGEDIPLASRIVFAADAFDAMTSARPYNEPRSAEGAIRELRACAGTQFDPVVVEAFAVGVGGARLRPPRPACPSRPRSGLRRAGGRPATIARGPC